MKKYTENKNLEKGDFKYLFNPPAPQSEQEKLFNEAFKYSDHFKFIPNDALEQEINEIKAGAFAPFVSLPA